ncbi:MAG: ABC transporter permease [Thermoactinospora sp.]|nr:ABC transporter permease [Thermoactinospora sp.]
MIRDTWLFFGYEMRALMRNPVWPLLGLMQPVLYLLLFAPLFAGQAFNGDMGKALDVFAPGMLVMTALFSSFTAGYGTIMELKSGVLERLAVSPASRPAILLGRMLRDTVMLLVQSAVFLVLGFVLGMRIGVLALVLMLLLMVATGLMAAGAAYGLALATKDENAMGSIMQFVMLPLMLLSGALLPMAYGPDWLEKVAWFTPFYHPTEAGRALFASDFGDLNVVLGFVIMLGLAALTISWSVRGLRRLAG